MYKTTKLLTYQEYSYFYYYRLIMSIFIIIVPLSSPHGLSSVDFNILYSNPFFKHIINENRFIYGLVKRF